MNLLFCAEERPIDAEYLHAQGRVIRNVRKGNVFIFFDRSRDGTTPQPCVPRSTTGVTLLVTPKKEILNGSSWATDHYEWEVIRMVTEALNNEEIQAIVGADEVDQIHTGCVAGFTCFDIRNRLQALRDDLDVLALPMNCDAGHPCWVASQLKPSKRAQEVMRGLWEVEGLHRAGAFHLIS